MMNTVAVLKCRKVDPNLFRHEPAALREESRVILHAHPVHPLRNAIHPEILTKYVHVGNVPVPLGSTVALFKEFPEVDMRDQYSRSAILISL